MAGHAQAMLFYAALLPGFVDLRRLTAGDFVLVALMLVIVIGGINAAYAVRGGTGAPVHGRTRERSARCTASPAR